MFLHNWDAPFEQAMKIDPKNAKAHKLKGIVLIKQGRSREAISPKGIAVGIAELKNPLVFTKPKKNGKVSDE